MKNAMLTGIVPGCSIMDPGGTKPDVTREEAHVPVLERWVE